MTIGSVLLDLLRGVALYVIVFGAFFGGMYLLGLAPGHTSNARTFLAIGGGGAILVLAVVIVATISISRL